MKRLCFFVLLMVFGSRLQATNTITMTEVALLDSSANRIFMQATIDKHNVIHLFYPIHNASQDYIIHRFSYDQGLSWSSADTIYIHPHKKHSNYGIFELAPYVDDQNALHLMARIQDAPNVTYSDYPPTHLYYLTNASGSWQVTANVLDVFALHNSNSPCYMYSTQIIQFGGLLHLIAKDHSWAQSSSHVCYSNYQDGQWQPMQSLFSVPANTVSINLQAPKLFKQNDTLYAVWYNRVSCQLQYKALTGDQWSEVKTIFNDKYFNINSYNYGIPEAYYQSGSHVALATIRTPTSGYNELLLATKSENHTWKVDTTTLDKQYRKITVARSGNHDVILLGDQKENHAAGLVNHWPDSGFSALSRLISSNGDSIFENIQTIGANVNPVIYSTLINNKRYLKVAIVSPLLLGIGEDDRLVDNFSLEQNYPNPFNPRTTIAYRLQKPGQIKLRVYDIQGRLVCNLFSGWQSAGQHRVQFDAGQLPSGIYFYRLESNQQCQTRRMILLK